MTMFSEVDKAIGRQTYKGERFYYIFVFLLNFEEFEKICILLYGSNLVPQSALVFREMKTTSIEWMSFRRKNEQKKIRRHHTENKTRHFFVWFQKSFGNMLRLSFHIELEKKKYWHSNPFS